MCSLSAIVLGLSVWWYGQVDLAQPNLATCLADPARHAGQVIIIDRESKITAVRPGGALEVTESGLGQDVRCRLEGASGDLGDPITLEGRFEPPDRVIALRVHTAKLRFHKVYLSLVAVAWVGWLLGSAFRPGPAGIEES